MTTSASSFCQHGAVKDSYWHNPGKFPLRHTTIGRLIDQAAARWPTRDAVITLWSKRNRSKLKRESITFKEVKDKADKLAAGFINILRLRRGDRVAIWASNGIEWYLTQMAAAKAGLILVNVNPAFYENELRYCLKKVSVRALLVAEKHRSRSNLEIIEAVLPEMHSSMPGCLISETVPTLESVVVIGEEKWKGSFQFDELIEGVNNETVDEVRRLGKHIQPDEGCNIQFTSGTTGEPKGTLLSHHNIINNVSSMARRIGLENKHNKVCLQVPLFHCFGCVVGTMLGLEIGATMVMPSPNFDPSASIKAMREERCNILYGTPTMYVDVLEQYRKNGKEVLRSEDGWEGLDLAVSGGAPCSEHLIRQLMENLNVRRMCSIYGMTETSPISFQTTPLDTMEQMLSTVGYVSEHVEVKVVDNKGEMVPMGTPGELWVRGYCNMLGYWGDEDRTNETIGPDRWLRTGDQFMLMENGYGKVVGRLKDMIIRGGENIFPKEIEEFLESHQSIAEVQVFGIPDNRLGEIVCAWIRLRKGTKLTENEVKAFCKDKVSHHIWDT
ncbi:hypothetical protein J437_LFUL003333 [Ladona fulva]|uniref:Medium-chain acyl-CoA ligase ACSF2, mitochondrial n=1 Tax=Ladona fulva TaxID=123851 RepID=A0A8K0P155_LADFU|nr:hypothetical protein J437_LFUL003333 [Ladona fulva]